MMRRIRLITICPIAAAPAGTPAWAHRPDAPPLPADARADRVTNGELDELWRAVPDGTPIRIRP